MSTLKAVASLTLSLLAFGAYHVAVGFAEEGVLPSENQAFTIALGEGALETLGGEKISCKELNAEGTFLEKSDQHGTGTIDFKGCTATSLKLSVNSLGDSAGTILAKGLALLCLINSKELRFGVLLEPSETAHIEIPAVKELLLFKGSVIIENLSANTGKTFEGRLEGKSGDQVRPLECEINGKKFKFSAEGGADTHADEMLSVNGRGTLTLAKEVQLMDTLVGSGQGHPPSVPARRAPRSGVVVDNTRRALLTLAD